MQVGKLSIFYRKICFKNEKFLRKFRLWLEKYIEFCVKTSILKNLKAMDEQFWIEKEKFSAKQLSMRQTLATVEQKRKFLVIKI